MPTDLVSISVSSVVLRFEYQSQPVGCKAQAAGPQPQPSVSLDWGLMCIPGTFLGEADATVPENPPLRTTLRG